MNSFLTQAADTARKPKDFLHKVYMANLAYMGPQHAGCMLDLARIVSDFLGADCERAVAVILFPNTGSVGAGASFGAVTAAQRAVTTMMEDTSWQLEVREFCMMWEESTMYSTSRHGMHQGLVCFSSTRKADSTSFRNCFALSQLYVRRAIAGVPVLQRANFINPARKSTMNDLGKLSEAAELKQHISGVGMWSQAGTE